MKSEMGKIDVNYKCSVCGGLVEVVKHDHAEPEIKRSCGHEGAIVHAWLSGTLKRVTPQVAGVM
jgi:DNA-directed RNA polymerase subunit RPC12/RpoP